MQRFLFLMVPMFLLAAACGDDGGGGGGLAGSGGDFCSMIRAFDAADAESDELDFTDPEQIEAAFGEMSSQLDTAAKVAPSEIKDDVELIVGGMRAFIDILEENDFDFMALLSLEDDPRLEALDAPEVAAAEQRIDDYCGVGDTPVDSEFGDGVGEDTDAPGIDPDEIDFGDGDARDIAVQTYLLLGHDQETAECLADNLEEMTDTGDLDLDMEVCGMSLMDVLGGG